MTILSPSLSVMNSASVVLRSVSVCILEAQVIGQPDQITFSVLDFAVVLSMCTVSAFQFPLKSASHQSSSEPLVGSSRFLLGMETEQQLNIATRYDSCSQYSLLFVFLIADLYTSIFLPLDFVMVLVFYVTNAFLLWLLK